MDPDEFQRLKAFLRYILDHHVEAVREGPPEIHPVRVLESMEARAPKRAIEGLRMAINDIVEMTQAWTPAEVDRADADLKALGAATLTEVRIAFSRDLQRIERRGRIKTEVEAYLVTNVIDSGDLSPDRRARLNAMIEEWAGPT